MIKRQLMATVSCLALTGAASAADMRAPVPMKAPAPAVVTQIWAGPYIGINGGVAWHRLRTDTTVVDIIGVAPFDSARINTTGGTFGGQVGYNWQSQNFVYGLEADINWVGGKGSDQHIANNGLGQPISYTTKLSWLATLRARGGVTFGPTLLFLTGGLAVGGVKNDWTLPTTFLCIGGAAGCPVSDHSTRVGWTAGGGFERFIASNLTVKAEALYVDLGRKNASDLSASYTSRFKNTAILGRLGLNLKW